MPSRLLKAFEGLRSSLPTRRHSTLLVIVSAVCVVTPLVLLTWLHHKTDEAIDRPPTSEQELLNGRYRALSEYHTTAVSIAWITATVGLLSSLATLYWFNRLHQALHDRTTHLQENKVLLEAIANSVTDSMFTLDPQGQIETLNPAAVTMFGYDSTEMLGKNFTLLLNQSSENHSNNLDTTAVQPQKRLANRKLGAPFPIELSLGHVSTHQRRIAIVRDISHQEQTEAELQSRTDELARVTAELTQARVDLQTVYMTCHDLKSPLQAIIHLSEWIESDLDERVRADTQNQINLLRERTQRMEGLVKGILKSAPPQESILES